MSNAPQVPDTVVARFTPQRIDFTGGQYRDETFDYQLLTPLRVEPGERYPLVLFLHGLGERGRDNRLQLMYLPEWMSRDEWRRRFPCYLLAPQCPPDGMWVEPLSPNAPIKWNRGADDRPLAPAPLAMVEAILDDACRTLPIDSSRVYLTGLSMGGYGTWLLAVRQAERFAAVAPVCGGGDVHYAARLAGAPLWAVHGADDGVVPPVRSREMIEAIRAAGGEPRYTELAGVGHDSWTAAYSDQVGLLEWLFAQRRPS
ncbi:MAG: phospholipase [Pirellulales bacterium]